MKQRLILVINPRSSNFSSVKTEIIDRLNSSEFRNLKTEIYEIEPTSPIENAKKIAKFIKSGDKILAAGGDGTCHIATNALIISGSDAQIAYAGFGNFNDYAGSFSKNKPQEILNSLICPRSIRQLTPVKIMINGEFYRYAALYSTIGITARIADVFELPDVRQKLKKIRSRNLSHIFSLIEATKFYFKNRHKISLEIEKITIDGQKITPKTKIADILMMNGPRMARIMRSKTNRQQRADFGFQALDSSKIIPSLPFIAKSLAAQMPLRRATNVKIAFKKPQTMMIQIEGEAEKIDKVEKIEFVAEKQPINILQ